MSKRRAKGSASYPSLDKALKVTDGGGEYQLVLLLLFAGICFALSFVAYAFMTVFFVHPTHIPTELLVASRKGLFGRLLYMNPHRERLSVIEMESIDEFQTSEEYGNAIASVIVTNVFLSAIFFFFFKFLGTRVTHTFGLLLCLSGALLVFLIKNVWHSSVGVGIMLYGAELAFPSLALGLQNASAGDFRERSVGFCYLAFGLGSLCFLIIYNLTIGYSYIYVIVFLVMLPMTLAVNFVPRSFGDLLKSKNLKGVEDAIGRVRRADNKFENAKIFSLEFDQKSKAEVLSPDTFKDNYLKVFGVMAILGNLMLAYCSLAALSHVEGAVWLDFPLFVHILSELAAYGLVTAAAPFCSKKVINIACASMLCGLSIALFFLPGNVDLFKRRFDTEPCILWAIRFVVCINYGTIYTYLTDVLPIRLQRWTVGFSTLYAKLSALLIIFLTNHFELEKKNPIVFLIFTSVLAVVSAAFLPGKALKH